MFARPRENKKRGYRCLHHRIAGPQHLESRRLLACNLAGSYDGFISEDACWDDVSAPYVVSGDLRIANGVTLEIKENVQIQLSAGVEITVYGTLDISSADSITAAEDCCSGISGIVVNGNMSVTDTAFKKAGSGRSITQLLVNPGAKLEATNSHFLWDQVWFAAESDLEPGDLTANTIASNIHVPGEKVSRLADNKSLANLILHGGELTRGEVSNDTLTLRVLGTEDTGSMHYWLSNDYTIQEGTTLEVGENVRLTLFAGVEITVDGTLDISSADTITAAEDCCSGTSGIIVNGSMSVSDTAFNGSGSGRSVTQLLVNPGAKLEATNSRFLWDVTTLGDTAVGVLHLNRFANQLTISQTATTDIVKNDLSSVTILGTGDESLPLDLRENWWGTIDPNAIRAKIPTNVEFMPFLNQPPKAPNLAATSISVASNHPLVGQAITVDYSIANVSPATDAEPTGTLFFLNNGDSLEGAALLRTVETAAITAEGSIQRTVTLNLPDATHPVWRSGLPGTYSISVLVDAFDQLVEWNEDNNVASTNVNFGEPATVVARRLFYNNSFFDGHDISANDPDDLVIAPDKTGLQPGQEASTAHVSYFSRGINGITIDVKGLRATPNIEDFQFSVASTPDASRFRAAPDPLSIVTRIGVGIDGSDRVMLTWDDGAITNQWLRVEILATSNTGLDRPDAFFFGNELADGANAKASDIDLLHALVRTKSDLTAYDLDVELLVRDIHGTRFGDTDIDGDVDFTDFLKLSKHFGSSIPSWSAGDFNGDGAVGFEDFLLLASNFGFTAFDAAFA